MDDTDYGAQPACPTCGVAMHPIRHGDECRECGHRVEWPRVDHPGFGEGITELDDWR